MKADGGGLQVLGLPVTAWTFAIRTWAAMMMALYVAFWLQLPSGDVGAVSVGILAVPTRGPTISKAVLRVGGTAVGMLASVVLAALFDQSRSLFLGALAVWLAGCTFLAGLLDDDKAYVAVLSGYTVAIVALPNIDTPLGTYASAVDRGASIVLALVVLAVAENFPAAPGTLPGLLRSLQALDRDIRQAADASRKGSAPGAAAMAELCGRITALRAGAYALSAESIAGRARSAAARRALAAMAAELWDSRLPVDGPRVVRAGFASTPGRDSGGALAPSQPDAARGHPARDLAVEDALRSLASGMGPAHGPALAVARPVPEAASNAVRVLLIFAFASVFYVLSGLPQTTDGLLHVALYICIAMTVPDPRVYALATVLATAVVVLGVGVTEFLILDGVDAFPLLAIGLFPMVVGAGLLRADHDALRSAMGTRILVFSIFILSPGLSQSYDPQHYLSESLEVLIGAFIFAVGSVTVLPAHPEARRGWLLDAARADLETASAGRGGTGVESAYRLADIVAQMGRLARTGGPGAEAALDEACRLADAAWGRRCGASPGRLPRTDG